jgi:hypothetical protein
MEMAFGQSFVNFNSFVDSDKPKTGSPGIGLQQADSL